MKKPVSATGASSVASPPKEAPADVVVPRASMADFLLASPAPSPAPAPVQAVESAATAASKHSDTVHAPATPADGIVLVKAVSAYAGASEVDVSFHPGDMLLMTSRVRSIVLAYL